MSPLGAETPHDDGRGAGARPASSSIRPSAPPCRVGPGPWRLLMARGCIKLLQPAGAGGLLLAAPVSSVRAGVPFTARSNACSALHFPGPC